MMRSLSTMLCSWFELLLFFSLAFGRAGAAWAGPDHQMWTTGGVTVNAGGPWRISQDVVLRFSDQKYGLYEVEATTSLGYRIAKDVTLWAGYTHDPQYSDGEHTVTEHRIREQVTFDDFATIGKARLSGRLRFEERWRDGGGGTAWRMRPYLKLALPFAGKADLNLSTEQFVQFNETNFQKAQAIARVRNMVSISGPLSKQLTGEAGYMNQHAFLHQDEEETSHIAYFAISLRL